MKKVRFSKARLGGRQACGKIAQLAKADRLDQDQVSLVVERFRHACVGSRHQHPRVGKPIVSVNV